MADNHREGRQRHSKQSNISTYRKPLNINIGMIIFGVMFFYIVVCIIMYFRTDHLSGYEVKTGSLSINNVYRGIALRDETIYNANTAGYVYYFAPEGTHVGVSDLVYTVDTAGTLSDTLNVSTDDSTLTNDDLKSLRNRIINFQSSFNESKFETVYDFKYELKNEVTKLSNNTILEAINSIDGAASGINKNYADTAGIVVFSNDGMEALTPENVSEDTFKEENYLKNQYISNDLIGNNDPVYKLVTNEDWNIVILVDNNRAQELSEMQYVKVRFLEDQYETNGKVTLYGKSEDGESTFVGLKFTNSMINYVTDRFIDLELILEEESGLKIPNSAIAERNFFLIPKDFIIPGTENGKEGVMRQSFTEDNQMTTEFVETTVYNVDDKDIYYVDASVLSAGDTLYKENSTETFMVQDQASLVGVYNINKGYADFKQIQVLYQNDEYSIVESNTQYGLSTYDYIALDASTVEDEQFIYE